MTGSAHILGVQETRSAGSQRRNYWRRYLIQVRLCFVRLFCTCCSIHALAATPPTGTTGIIVPPYQLPPRWPSLLGWINLKRFAGALGADSYPPAHWALSPTTRDIASRPWCFECVPSILAVTIFRASGRPLLSIWWPSREWLITDNYASAPSWLIAALLATDNVDN